MIKYFKKYRIFISITILFMIIVFLYSHIKILKVQGNSMEPSISNGEYVVSTDLMPVHSGDIGLVHFISMNRNEYFLKRLIATEGQTILIKDGIIYINGKPRQYGPSVQWTKNVNFNVGGKPLMIIPGWSFVLGDNRDNSTDSRELGLAKVVQKVLFAIP